MKFTFAGKNVEFTGAMKIITTKKILGLRKYNVIPYKSEARVLARTYKDDSQKVEITISSDAGGLVLRAEVTDRDYYVAVDKAIEVLKDQIRREKTKKENGIKARKEFIDEQKFTSVNEAEAEAEVEEESE